MSKSGWCSSGQHGALCKWGKCSCECHEKPAAEQLKMVKEYEDALKRRA